MNKMMTVILSATIGGVVGYFVGKKHEVIEVRRAIEDSKDRITNKNIVERLNDIDRMNEIDTTSPYEPPEDKPNLEDLASRYRTDDEHPTEDEPDEPYVITYDEFSEIGTNYTELIYYDEDDTLVDDTDRVLDIPSTVGDCLSEFGVGTDDINMVYVKNPKTGTYYEVTRVFEPYYPVD